MKILQVIDSLKTGGAELLLTELCLQWKKCGLDVEIFVLRNEDAGNHDRVRDSGIGVTTSEASKLYSPMHVRALAQLMSRKRFDLVHVHLHPAQLWTAMALRASRTDTPGITTEHNTWNRRRDHLWYGPIDRWVYAQFRMAVCIGTSTKSSLDDWLGPGICPSCVIPNGISLERFRPHQTPARLPEGIGGAPTVLCVGSLTDRKDQETLVRAAAQVEGIHVLLVGEGPLKQSIQQVVRELQVEDRVHFLGVRHDISELAAAATIYVQPSRVDGFCIATLEAMACGLPVVVTDIPGLGDLARDCGLLFLAGDHGALAQRIRQVLADPLLRRDLSSRGIAEARNYSVEKTAARYETIFEATVNRTINQDKFILTS